MALGSFVAGRYSATLNAVDVGITRDGYELRFQGKGERIDKTDVYAQTLIDFVYQGGGDCTLAFQCMEYKAGSMAAFWPWGSLGVVHTTAAPVARLASDVATALVLTSTANTPAAAAPATLTGSKAILSPDFPVAVLFDSRLRVTPVQLTLLPTLSGGTLSFFTTT